MEKWHWTALLLCGFGFFKELRPSEQYVTEYLKDYKGFSSETIVQVAYPISTYTYLGMLPVVFMLTDLLKYRPLIVLEGIGFVGTYALLIWGEGLTSLKILEVLYGIAGACEVAYYTYIYTNVEKENYRKVTSYVHSAIFIGNLAAAVLSQVLVSAKIMDYYQLNFISLGGVGFALFISFFLPAVKNSIYFHRNDNWNDSETENTIAVTRNPENSNTRLQEFRAKLKSAYRALWTDFIAAYSNPHVIKWSFWWALAAAVHYQVTNYIQSLWEVIEPDSENSSWNGAVGATQCALSAAFALLIARIDIGWDRWGEGVLSVVSILQGGALVWMSKTPSIYICYILYIIYRTLFQVIVTVANAEVAQCISKDSYGLIFGINTFLAVGIQTIITLTVTAESGLALSEKAQFTVYGVYYIILGIVFLTVVIITFARSRNLSTSPELPAHPRSSGSQIEKETTFVTSKYPETTEEIKILGQIQNQSTLGI